MNKPEPTVEEMDLAFTGFRDKQFIAAFELMAAYVHNWAVRKGWWDEERNDGEIIANIHREISEAWESLRLDNPPDKHIPEFDSYTVELADTIIRILDLVGGRNLRVSEAIVAKMAFNEGRPYKHGKKF